MTPPTVDRFRYPWRELVPGEPHRVTIDWQDGSDQSTSTFELVMLDAYTGDPVTGVVYTIDDTAAATGVIIATAPIPADLDTALAYELRFRRDGETLIAGPVVFKPSVIPVQP